MSHDGPMTVRDLVTNPTGPNSRQVAARYTIRDALAAKFYAAMKDVNRRKKFGVSVTGTWPTFTVWIRVPSEEYDVIYDVILQLKFPQGVRAVSGAEIRLYCNAPSWVFTTGYAAKKADLLFPGWEKALGRAATEAPKVTNPNLDVGFDKVVQQGILYMLGPAGITSYNDIQQASSVRNNVPNPKDPQLSAESKLFEYNRAKDKHAAQARLEKAAERSAKELDEKRRKADVAAARSQTAATKRTASTAAKTAKMAKTAKTAKVAKSR